MYMHVCMCLCVCNLLTRIESSHKQFVIEHNCFYTFKFWNQFSRSLNILLSTHTHTHSLTPTHEHTHARTHARARARTHTHTHIYIICFSCVGTMRVCIAFKLNEHTKLGDILIFSNYNRDILHVIKKGTPIESHLNETNTYQKQMGLDAQNL